MQASNELETRRRRALYRACHRGTKELDLILGRFAQDRVTQMSEEVLDRFERLLALPDPDIESWVLHAEAGENAPDDLESLVEQLRHFHGLGNKGSG
ncbi:MAG: succinate dehydrogenase assembly factor 2, partial [Pseudomonadota bacterium]|nr:succinate dehydrogenase assembly factor 2 [Pseudomonadota bacterium]